MKEYFFTLSLFLPFALFAQSQQFDLLGKITGADDGFIRIDYKNKDGKSINDSCKIEDGNFRFNGNISAPTICYFWMNTPSAENNKLNATEFFLEPTSMFISIKKDDFRNAIIKGSTTQYEYYFRTEQFKRTYLQRHLTIIKCI